MHITAANSGDLLCMYQTGERLKVLDVSEGMVTFQQENGERYATRDNKADAFVDRDPARLSVFNANSRLGQALNAAEIKAMKNTLVAPSIYAPARMEANHVLSIVQEQKQALEQRMMQEQSREAPGKDLARAFLDQLYEMGTGSHDTFFGRRVENLSQYEGSFSVNGQRCSYEDALNRLSEGNTPASERKSGLDAMIASANRRRGMDSASGPALSADNQER